MTEHLGFIVAAYGVTAVVFLVTVVVLLRDHAAQRRQLARLEQTGRDLP